MEARWYKSVVKACALDRDFEELEAGELSLVGSKGVSLSGGQKARVVSADLEGWDVKLTLCRRWLGQFILGRRLWLLMMC